jgi:hypothetical protein
MVVVRRALPRDGSGAIGGRDRLHAAAG